MTEYIYLSSGEPVGFCDGDTIYKLDGIPVGKLRDTHVYGLSGEYVGELRDDMLVDENRNMGSIGSSSPGLRGARNPAWRGAKSCSYPDAWHKLISSSY